MRTEITLAYSSMEINRNYKIKVSGVDSLAELQNGQED